MSEVRERAVGADAVPDEAPDVERTLARALAQLLAAIRTCDDGVLDARTADEWTERTAHVLGRLTPAGRQRLDPRRPAAPRHALPAGGAARTGRPDA
ncbi:hypothetical protein ACF1G0_03475 [Streptomyces sp. NPDC013953]|uniref:hypothetical protein n=1 Tax=Streptomyces sp. NPDC013953 TaxID=3364868 RepID=UPI0036FAB2D8